MEELKKKLEALGLTPEQVKSVVSEVTPIVEQEVKGLKDKNFELLGDKKNLTAKLTELQAKVPQLNSPPPEPVVPENKPDPLLVELAESVKALQKQIQTTQEKSLKNTLITKYLPDAKNHNLILSQLDMSKLTDADGRVLISTDDGQQVEINTVFDAMRKSEDTNFLFGKPATTAVKRTTTVMGIEIPLSDPEPVPVDNPWASKTLNYTRQNEILIKNPELATKLKEAAKSETNTQPTTGQAQQSVNPVQQTSPSVGLINPYA